MRTMRRFTLPATLVASTLAGCSTDTITSSGNATLDAIAIRTAANVDRPWKGTCAVRAEFLTQNTLLIQGTCQLAHLGRTSVREEQTIGAPDPGTGVIQYINVATYTTANGDQLRVLGVGSATPSATGLTLLGTETADGGTGRFANATGTATLRGAVSFTGPASTSGFYSLDGTLNY